MHTTNGLSNTTELSRGRGRVQGGLTARWVLPRERSRTRSLDVCKTGRGMGRAWTLAKGGKRRLGRQ